MLTSPPPPPPVIGEDTPPDATDITNIDNPEGNITSNKEPPSEDFSLTALSKAYNKLEIRTLIENIRIDVKSNGTSE